MNKIPNKKYPEQWICGWEGCEATFDKFDLFALADHIEEHERAWDLEHFDHVRPSIFTNEEIEARAREYARGDWKSSTKDLRFWHTTLKITAWLLEDRKHGPFRNRAAYQDEALQLLGYPLELL